MEGHKLLMPSARKKLTISRKISHGRAYPLVCKASAFTLYIFYY
jgi:hypothetical protein